MATELENPNNASEDSDGYDEAIEAIHDILNSINAAGPHKSLRTFNLINSLFEIIEEPTLEDPKPHEQIPG